MDEKIKREALVRVRAKAFASDLRAGGWAKFIPDEDVVWLKDDELELYKATIQEKNCRMRADFRWEYQQPGY